MDIIEAEKHLKIIKHGKKLIKYIGQNEDIDILIKNSKDKINHYNNQKLQVLNITNIEEGRWKGTLKKIIMAKYVWEAQKKYKYKEDVLCSKCELKRKLSNRNTVILEDCEIKCRKQYYKIEDYNSKISDQKNKVHIEFMDAIEKTIITDEYKQKYTLLSRKIKKKSRLTPLEKSIKETIRIQIIKTFEKQNKNLINKYL